MPRDLTPGEATTVAASVEVPDVPGALTLQWDLLQEDVTWFGERGSPVAEVNVNVTAAQPATETALPPTPSQLGSTASPPRTELWRAGVKMWLTYPLLGVGPDNFRHVYGAYLGQTEFDDRITANTLVCGSARQHRRDRCDRRIVGAERSGDTRAAGLADTDGTIDTRSGVGLKYGVAGVLHARQRRLLHGIHTDL